VNKKRFLLFWSLLWTIFFGDLLLGQVSLSHSDLTGQFHAFAVFQAQEMLAGRLPLWSPGSFAGFPFAADAQAAVFYPIRWLTILLSAPVGFSYYVLTLEGLFHIWLAGLFTYLLVTDQTGNPWAGTLAAVAFALGDYLISYPLLQLAVLETIVWLPLILWLLRRGVRAASDETGQKRPLPYLLAAGVVWGISLTAGHPQTFLHLSYLVLAYYLFLTLRAGWSWRWLAGMGLLVGGTAVGTAAAAWLPTLRYLGHTTRSDVVYEFVASGFPLLDYLQLFVPGSLTTWSPMYVGLATLALLLVAWLGRSLAASEQRAEIGFWTAVSLLTFLLSLGDKGILFELFYHLAPGFDLFRHQERIVGLLSLSMALLSAQGLTIWWSANAKVRRYWLQRITAVLLTSFLLTALFLTAMNEVKEWHFLWLRQAVILLGLLLILRPYDSSLSQNARAETQGRKGHLLRVSAPLRELIVSTLSRLRRIQQPQLMVWPLLLLLSTDLYLAGRDAIDLQPLPPRAAWVEPAWVDLLPTDQPARIDSSNLFHANMGELFGLEDIRGLSPLKLEAMHRLDVLPNGRRWQLLNVTHVLDTKTPIDATVTEVASVTQHIMPDQSFRGAVYRFEDALPRAWLVYQPHFAPDEEAAYWQIADRDFDPATEVVLTGALDRDLWTAVSPPTQPPHTKTRRLDTSALHIEAHTDTPGILVISEWDYPGWQVRVNGQPAVTATANSGFIAVLLPTGSHTITLRFAPWDVPVGMALSLLTLLGAGGLAWRWRPIVALRGETTKVSQTFVVWPTLARQPDQAINKSRVLWGGTAVFFLAFILRLFRLGHQELRGDEAFSYLFAAMPPAESVPALLAGGDPHSPLHYLLLHGWLTLTGDTEFALRYLSLLLSLLLLPLVYQLGRLLGGQRLGVLAAFLMAISQSLIWLAQDVRNQYMLVQLLGLLATVLLVGYLRPHQSSAAAHRSRPVLWGVYVVVAATAVYSHYYGLFILVAHGFYLWLPSEGRWRRLTIWAASGVAAALLFIPWLLIMWPHLLASGHISHPSDPELAAYLLAIGRELSVGAALPGWGTRWLVAGVAGLLLIGFWALYRSSRRPAALLLASWLGLAVLGIFLVRFTRETYNDYYLIVTAPAWWLLISAALLFFWQQARRRWRLLALAGLALLVGGNGLSLYNYYFDPAHSRTSGYREMAARIATDGGPHDLFLAHFPDPSLDYYLRNRDLPIEVQPAGWGTPPEATENRLAELAYQYERIWFVPYLNSPWDPINVVGSWLDYHMLHERHGATGRMRLWAFRSVAFAPDIMTAESTTFGELITLTGIYATVDGQPVDLAQPVSLDQASNLTITLLWQSDQPLSDNYTVFVHLLDETGWMVAQHDGVPLFGTRPTTTWQPGERLLDRHEIMLPGSGGLGSGHGRIIVGLYHSETIERLPPAPMADALTVGRWGVGNGR
jgi:hypothetical protein